MSAIQRRPSTATRDGKLPPPWLLSQLLEKLQERRDSMAERWAALLYIEPVNGPLANPDALIHLIPYSIELLFAALDRKRQGAPVSLTGAKVPVADCRCGKNPYHRYFAAGIQAVTETFILLQTELPRDEQRETDLAAVIHAVRQLAATEIETFCGVCSYRGTMKNCARSATPAG